jgi:hypothetical protein
LSLAVRVCVGLLRRGNSGTGTVQSR